MEQTSFFPAGVPLEDDIGSARRSALLKPPSEIGIARRWPLP